MQISDETSRYLITFTTLALKTLLTRRHLRDDCHLLGNAFPIHCSQVFMLYRSQCYKYCYKSQIPDDAMYGKIIERKTSLLTFFCYTSKANVCTDSQPRMKWEFMVDLCGTCLQTHESDTNTLRFNIQVHKRQCFVY